jgi:histidine kinase
MASSSISTNDSLRKALDRVAELEEALRVSELGAGLASQDLQHFVYAASHDLQEPLRAITTYAQLLERLYQDDPQTHELAGFITTGVLRMNSLLQSLLTYARLNPSPPLRQVNLNGPVEAALYKLTPVITETGAVVEFDSLPEIAAHEIQLGQLFEQLISNALLFRRGAPVIRISADERELEGDHWQVIRVEDNGVGIEPQFLMQVVQPFKRLHGKDFPGNGLGLAICDKVMRAHKGKFWLESDGSTGTSVYAAFPV